MAWRTSRAFSLWLLSDDLFRMPGEPQDMQAGTGPVGAVDETAIVHFDVVGLDHLRARRRNSGIARWKAHALGGAVRHRVLVRRGNEIGDLLHGKRVANVEHARAGVEPRKDRQLPVVR